MSLRRAGAPALAVAALALAATGCGGSSSMPAQVLRTRAARVCTVATQRLNAIPSPQVPSDGAPFLRRGIAALRPELTALSAMHPGGELGVHFREARDATEQELKVLQSSLKGLKAGNDPIVAMKTLQTQLAPREAQAGRAWRALGVRACADT
ncbi:MAG TPA: hypothetical protein VHV28_12055 [Solirubrobacteraceae bacterium]|nr:hypothetical protein [Solirubrobacteraceae bacterium]